MPAVDRCEHARTSLRRLLEPRHVALVGASADPRSLGGRTWSNLRGFPGRVYPVNPRYPELDGVRCYPSVDDLPEAPDLVLLAVPREAVEGVVARCAARGTGAVVVFASGYAETGRADGARAQARLVSLARSAGMRIVGPNCVGVARQASGMLAAFAEFSSTRPAPGARIALVSQSGAVGLALSHAAEHGTSLGHVLTCGNSCDVDVADYVAWLAGDPECDAVALVFEGVDDARRLGRASAMARRAGKPVVFCQVGTSRAGRAAARFHTGTANAGDADCLRALRRAGAVPVSRIEALLETTAFLAKAGPARRKGVAIVSSSGGTAILAADAAARHAVPLPQPNTRTVQRLRELIPPFGAARNPCDVTAQATRNPLSLLGSAEALLADPRFGALVVPWGRAQPADLLPGLGEASRRHDKPVCLVWTSQFAEAPSAEAIERRVDLALFRSFDACFQTIACWQRARTRRPSPTG